mmetsp:Transcript_20109/g.62937  ORF Transcript_20109/g.62937 Transcript_20109/m.62937 type:complete len:343 (-) Transcript_20109:312-1340(-)
MVPASRVEPRLRVGQRRAHHPQRDLLGLGGPVEGRGCVGGKVAGAGAELARPTCSNRTHLDVLRPLHRGPRPALDGRRFQGILQDRGRRVEHLRHRRGLRGHGRPDAPAAQRGDPGEHLGATRPPGPAHRPRGEDHPGHALLPGAEDHGVLDHRGPEVVGVAGLDTRPDLLRVRHHADHGRRLVPGERPVGARRQHGEPVHLLRDAGPVDALTLHVDVRRQRLGTVLRLRETGLRDVPGVLRGVHHLLRVWRHERGHRRLRRHGHAVQPDGHAGDRGRGAGRQEVVPRAAGQLVQSHGPEQHRHGYPRGVREASEGQPGRRLLPRVEAGRQRRAGLLQFARL